MDNDRSAGVSWRRFAVCLAGVLVAAAMIHGCTGLDRRAEKTTFMDEWRARAADSKGHSPGPGTDTAPMAEVPDMTVPHETEKRAPAPAPVAEPERPLPTEEISMKMRDVELSVLLRALARIAGQNIMINENVKGKTSININRASWDQVFLGILKTNGLTYKWEGDIIRIVTIADMKNEIEFLSEEQTYEQKKKEHLLKMESLSARTRLAEPLETKIVRIGYADPETIQKNLEKFLQSGAVGTDWTIGEKDEGKVGGEVRGAILVDPHTRSLMIQAVASDIQRLLPIIRELDRPTQQIIIEAQIVEATQETARDLGVQWGGLYLNASGDVFNWLGSDGVSGQNLYDTDGNPQWFQPAMGNIVSAGTEDITEGGSIAYTYQRKGIGALSVQLKALQSEGELNVLSSPFITTLDNQTATIESGREIPYQTVEDGEVKIEYKEALVKLEVKPSVIDRDTLRLEIQANKDEPDFANTAGGQPTIITRKAKTTVFLYDGQTTVIGGLSKKNVSDGETGVPGLAGIPLLGSLFKGQSKENQFDELLIFITPRILKQRVGSPVPDTAPRAQESN